MTSSSRCSSSSFHSSSRYSCSSITSIQSEASSTVDPIFHPLLDRRSSSLFGGCKGDSETFLSLGGESETFKGYQVDRMSHTGGYQVDWSHGETQGHSSCTGPVRVDDGYFLSADVSRFEPHDIVVMAFNNSVVIHAEKIGDDGGATDQFTQKSLLPQDMNPLSVSGTLTPEGLLVISEMKLSPGRRRESISSLFFLYIVKAEKPQDSGSISSYP